MVTDTFLCCFLFSHSNLFWSAVCGHSLGIKIIGFHFNILFLFCQLNFSAEQLGSSSVCCVMCFLFSIDHNTLLGVLMKCFDGCHWSIALRPTGCTGSFVFFILFQYTLIKWHPLLVKSKCVLRPSTQWLDKMWFKVMLVCAALLFIFLFYRFSVKYIKLPFKRPCSFLLYVNVSPQCRPVISM